MILQQKEEEVVKVLSMMESGTSDKKIGPMAFVKGGTMDINQKKVDVSDKGGIYIPSLNVSTESLE